MLTKCWIDSKGTWKPICEAYGHRWLMPSQPALISDWCLVMMMTSSHQMDAAAQDPRIQVYRSLFGKLTPETVTTYAAQGAAAEMSLGELLDLLTGNVHAGFGITNLLNWS